MRTAAAVLKILNGRVGRGCIGTHSDPCGLLTGSWAAISGVVSRVTLIVTHNNKDLITLLITTHEPPSRLGDWEVWLKDSSVGMQQLQKADVPFFWFKF